MVQWLGLLAVTAQIPLLVRKLRFQKPCSVAKKRKKPKTLLWKHSNIEVERIV